MLVSAQGGQKHLIPQNSVIGHSEPPAIGTGNQTQILPKNFMTSLLLSSLSSPHLNLIFHSVNYIVESVPIYGISFSGCTKEKPMHMLLKRS